MRAAPHPALANPMWHALSTVHAGVALDMGGIKRFPADIAPFCGVEHEGAAPADLRHFTSGETVYFLGTVPAMPAGWTVLGESSVLQMVFEGAPPKPDSEQARTLCADDVPAMLALTALVYPEFFRARTALLGKYIGLDGEGYIQAMAGQRLACPGYREISAVCTHPDHRGAGHASRLLRQLSGELLAAGETPFLHVSASNRKAWALYENLGFAPTRELRFVKVQVR